MRLMFSALKTWFSILFWVRFLFWSKDVRNYVYLFSMISKNMDVFFIQFILFVSSYVASTLHTQKPIATSKWSSGFSTVIKFHKKGCIFLGSVRFKAFKKSTKIKMWLLSPNKLFLIQYTHIHSCALSPTEEENNKDESSTKENVQYATSWMRLLSLCMYWRHWDVFLYREWNFVFMKGGLTSYKWKPSVYHIIT